MLGLFNVNETLSNELLKSIKTIKLENSFDAEIEAIFIDWIPTYDKDSAQQLITQVNIIEQYTKKKIPTIIFDRYRSLSNKEVNWLKKLNAKLFEPSLHLRVGFKYLPHWIKIKSLNEIELDDHERHITLLYKGDLSSERIKSFDDYYIEFANVNHKKLVVYNCNKVHGNKVFTINSTDKDYDMAQYTIIIGSGYEYKCGYLDPNFFSALNMGCIPLIPIEHRYYGNLRSIMIKPEDLKWYTEMNYYNIYLGLIYEINNEIETYYPEMDVKYTAQVIKSEI